jgi:hypothetical protein
MIGVGAVAKAVRLGDGAAVVVVAFRPCAAAAG